ncbi:MAG: spore cortex-lytic enzyme [Bacillota bacterium]|jgi:N-acetylmuramoyl-L-alanine amidase|nr:spore cortex-lytic enzyme [Bacillota bacterium]
MHLRRSIIGLAVGIAVIIGMFLCATSPAEAQTRPTLYWGSRGTSVRLVQWKLSDWGYYRGWVDGVFGANTHRAVVAFQRRNGLRVDGLVGPQTWRALGFGYTVAAAVAPPTYRPAPMASRSASVDLIARAISAEARGEPYRGQVAVGAVLMNRLRNARFPNSLSAVVFQPHALESVSNGLFWRRTPDAAAYSAARDAINGYDPSYGSLFFWNPAKPVSGWIWTRNIIVRIGKHVFAR